MYKIITDGGKYENGMGNLDFVQAKYKEKHETKKYNFTKYSDNRDLVDDKKSFKKKSVLASFVSDDNTEVELNPIRTDYTDSVFESDTEEAIVKNVNLASNNDSNKK